jgi:hypothetical protein
LKFIPAWAGTAWLAVKTIAAAISDFIFVFMTAPFVILKVKTNILGQRLQKIFQESFPQIFALIADKLIRDFVHETEIRRHAQQLRRLTHHILGRRIYWRRINDH